MQRISSVDAAVVFAAVCERHDPFANPFSSRMVIRSIFFPTNGYALTDPQWTALFAAHHEFSSAKIIVLPSELSRADWDEFGCWELEADADYRTLQSQGIFAIENTIVDRNGNWGVQLSQESHAVIGSTSEFSRVLSETYSELMVERRAFESHWHDRSIEGEDASWAFSLVKSLPDLPPSAPRG